MRRSLAHCLSPVLLLGPLILGGCDEASTPVQANEVEPGSLELAADQGEEPNPGPLLDFSALAIFLEFNSTDNDLGVQVVLDGEGWDRVRASGPTGKRVLDFRAQRELGDLGLTEVRFESAEPSPSVVLGSIPPGEYRFSARVVEGGRLLGTAILSHDLPAAPDFTPDEGDIVDPANTVIRWTAMPGLAGYEVIVVNEDTGADLEAFVGPGITSFTVPPEFMEPDSDYKAEVLSVANNGNKTITEHVFRTGS